MVVLGLASWLFTHKFLTSALPNIVLGLSLFCLGPLTAWVVRRRFKDNPCNGVEVTWAFNAEEFNSTGEGFNQMQSWKKVYEFLDTPAGFLIYPQKNLYYWIPFSGFSTHQEFENVRAIAKANVNRYAAVV